LPQTIHPELQVELLTPEMLPTKMMLVDCSMAVVAQDLPHESAVTQPRASS